MELYNAMELNVFWNNSPTEIASCGCTLVQVTGSSNYALYANSTENLVASFGVSQIIHTRIPH